MKRIENIQRSSRKAINPDELEYGDPGERDSYPGNPGNVDDSAAPPPCSICHKKTWDYRVWEVNIEGEPPGSFDCAVCGNCNRKAPTWLIRKKLKKFAEDVIKDEPTDDHEP